VEWINVNFFDTLEAMKNAVLLGVRPGEALPAACHGWVSRLLALAGWRLGGRGWRRC
jgi:glycine betaine/proline transport system permease protein